jgi:hypothetical protein
MPKPIVTTHAKHTIEVESYTDIDGCRKFSISSNGVTHHYLPDEFEEISIADALHNLLDPIEH